MTMAEAEQQQALRFLGQGQHQPADADVVAHFFPELVAAGGELLETNRIAWLLVLEDEQILGKPDGATSAMWQVIEERYPQRGGKLVSADQGSEVARLPGGDE